MARSRLVCSSLIALLALGACLALGGCAGTATSSGSSQVGRFGTGRGGYRRGRHQAIQPQPAPGSCHARGSGLYSLPDPRCTPGSTDPVVTQSNINSTICSYGYTRRVRPPESVSEPEKRASLAAYGERGPLRAYEYDHLIALELGGASNDPRNLWPEPGRTPNPKDELERRFHRLVCARAVALADAQHALARDWVAAYRRFGG